MFKIRHFTRETQFEGYSSDKNTSSSQVAIYNEDDLSHLLYLEAADHGSHIIINKVDHSEPETPVEGPLFIDTSGHTSDNESAILSDLEAESDLEIPPSPSRRRWGTVSMSMSMSMSDDDVEFPVFLGRQQEVEPQSSPARPLLQRGGPSSTYKQQDCLKDEPNKHVQVVAPEHHVRSIEGSLMSWWPAPLETMEYDWAGERTQPTIAPEKHVSKVQGPLMSWWPAPTEMLQYDWNERFYE